MCDEELDGDGLPVLLCAEADPPAGDDEPPGFFCPGCAEVAKACVCGGEEG